MPLSVKLIAVLLTIASVAVVTYLCVRGCFLDAAGFALLAVVCIGGGLCGQTPARADDEHERMKHYINDPRPDDEAGGVPMDMRDTRPIWKRFVMLFQGWCVA
jgi:hypothetical protein